MFAKVLNQSSPARFWAVLEDINKETRETWLIEPLKMGTLASTNYLPLRVSNSELELHKETMGFLLNVITVEWDKLFMQFSKPHLFIFTDSSGLVLEMKGSEGVVINLEKYNIGLGTSFALAQVGVNGISLAMEVRKPSLVRGKEHYLELFSEWTCVCQPILINGKVQGYVDLSIHSEEDFTWAFVLLGKLVADIEEKYAVNDPFTKKEKVMERLGECGLSSREAEVAWRWLNNQNTLQIASELFIAEGTVRNHIKKAYAKTGVCGKGKFMRDFIVW